MFKAALSIGCFNCFKKCWYMWSKPFQGICFTIFQLSQMFLLGIQCLFRLIVFSPKRTEYFSVATVYEALIWLKSHFSRTNRVQIKSHFSRASRPQYFNVQPATHMPKYFYSFKKHETKKQERKSLLCNCFTRLFSNF